MKLTIIRLFSLSQQDAVDLSKIWPMDKSLHRAQQDTQQLYAARFNDRLLAAALLEVNHHHGCLKQISVREVTRRRGVGRYLVEEIMCSNPHISLWSVEQTGIDDEQAMAGFMTALGFEQTAAGWEKKTPSV